MDIKAYVDNGNLEQYLFELSNTELRNEVAALTRIYPEIRQELDKIELTMEQLAQSHAIEPSPQLKSRFLAAIFPEAIDLSNLPPTGNYSNFESWLKAVEHLLPAEPFDDFFAHILQQNELIAQTLVVTRLDVPEEIHEAVAEGFFILKGSCACTVGDEIFTLQAGDYLDIPLHTKHDIRILSPYVVAILQHQF